LWDGLTGRAEKIALAAQLVKTTCHWCQRLSASDNAYKKAHESRQVQHGCTHTSVDNETALRAMAGHPAEKQ
jgi:hypothetical protein